jgi:D,D-heptose 1,7-bisphosphate phosphatase
MTGAGTFDVAILAGGRGQRLRDRTGDSPKPLVPLLGQPLLEYQLQLCKRHGFLRILLLVHYGHASIRDRIGDGSRYGVNVAYHVEETPLGTAGALREALGRLDDTFLVLYGDTYLDVDLRRMWDEHARRGADATLFVHPNDHPQDSDLVAIDAAGFVTVLHPYPHSPETEAFNLVNAALCVMRRAGLDAVIPAGRKTDLAQEVFPAMLRAGKRLFAYRSPEYIKDVGTPERLDAVEHDIAAGVPQRLSGRTLRSAVFLDRDGTLNKERGYVAAASDIELEDGAADAIRCLNRTGYLSVIITNQAGVARGAISPASLDAVHARLEHALAAKGAYLDGVYVCPHHPDSGFPGEVRELKIVCDCRKPRTGSIDAACRDLDIDRASSWFVGDTTSDIETGRRAALKTILVRTGHAGQDGKYPFRPDYVVPDLPAAVSWILEGHRALSRRMAPVALAALNARLVVIGGLARSGKSMAAQVLKEGVAALGRKAHILPLDSWLKPVTERTEGTGVVSRFDIDTMLATVTTLATSRTATELDLPVYDRARRTMYERRVPLLIAPDDLLVVEGVPALLVDELVNTTDVRVHVEIPEDQRVTRLRSDYTWRVTPEAELETILASRVLDESGPVQAGRARADFIVPAWTES